MRNKGVNILMLEKWKERLENQKIKIIPAPTLEEWEKREAESLSLGPTKAHSLIEGYHLGNGEFSFKDHPISGTEIAKNEKWWNNWHKKWWGQLILAIIAIVAGGIILSLI